MEAKNIPIIEDNLDPQQGPMESLQSKLHEGDEVIKGLEIERQDSETIQVEVVAKIAYATDYQETRSDRGIFLNRPMSRMEKFAVSGLATFIAFLLVGIILATGFLNGSIDISKSEIKSFLQEIVK